MGLFCGFAVQGRVSIEHAVQLLLLVVRLDYDGQGHNSFMRHAQVWFGLTIPLVLGGNAAVQCFNSKQ